MFFPRDRTVHLLLLLLSLLLLPSTTAVNTATLAGDGPLGRGPTNGDGTSDSHLPTHPPTYLPINPLKNSTQTQSTHPPTHLFPILYSGHPRRPSLRRASFSRGPDCRRRAAQWRYVRGFSWVGGWVGGWERKKVWGCCVEREVCVAFTSLLRLVSSSHPPNHPPTHPPTTGKAEEVKEEEGVVPLPAAAAGPENRRRLRRRQA